MADEAGPPEREVATLRFQQLCRLKIFDETPETLTPPERVHLVAVSNTYGYTFIGSDSGVKILQTTELGRLHELNRDTAGAVVSDYDCIKLSLGTRPVHVSLNSTELILSVCYHNGNNLTLNLYDVRVVTKKNTSHAPFISSVLSSDPEVRLVDLAWNPGFEHLVATCLSDRTCTVWDSSRSSLQVIGRLPTDVGATAVCWSPKGKQMVVGTSEGELKQFNHSSELKKVIKSPDFTQEAVRVVDIHWLSTYMFIVAYIDAEESLQPNVVVVHAPKDRPVSYINFEDICFGGCEDRTALYYMHYIDKWQFVITCSSNSIEGAVLGRQQENKDLWEIWTLDDAARIELPLCNHEETMPVGMTMDYTSQINVKIKQHTLPPAPILMVLSSEGLLCPFYVINLEDADGITTKPQPFPTGGERVGTGPAPQIQPAAAAKSQASFGQPAAAAASSFTAPASVAAPKPPSNAPSAQLSAPQPAFGAAAATGGQPSLFGGFSGAGGAVGGATSAGFQFKLPASTASAAAPSSGTQASSTLTTPAFGEGQSMPFGSGGFSFSATQTSTPSSSAAPAAVVSGSKGFSFAAPAQPTLQSAQQPVQSAQAFSFKVTSAPSGISSASSGSGFGAFSKPATTTTASVLGAPTALSSSQPAQLEKPKGPPNVTAPGSVGGLGQQGLFGKGPPNAVAPGSSEALSQGGLAKGPQGAVASGVASQLIQPGVVPTAPLPAAGSVPQGAASMIPKGAVAQTAPTGPTVSVAPATMASNKPAGFPVARPNAVTPTVGLPSFSEATASKDSPDAQRSAVGKPVAVVQQTPKASAIAGDHPRIPATSTPAASAKPVTDALLSNIKEEMEHFTKELSELKARAAASHPCVGSSKDLEDICKGVDDLTSFKAEVLESTKSVNEDIHGLKAKLLNSFSLVEESRLRKQRSKDPRYLQLLRSRGLDPQSAKQMQEIRTLYHCLETGIRDANACLDLEWDKITHRKGTKSTRRMVTPTMDTIYQTLGNHVNILTTQKNKLIDLRKQLTTAQRYDVTSSFNPLPSSKIKPDSDPSSLASRLAEVKVTSNKARSTPMSAKKQAMLRDILSQRQTTPIRSAPRAALASSSSVGSPSDLDEFPLRPERRLRFPSDESPPAVSQREEQRPTQHAGRSDLRGIGATTSSPAAQPAPVKPAPTQPMATQGVPHPPASISSHAPQQPVTRSTQPASQTRASQQKVAPPPPLSSSLNASAVPVSPIQPGAGMVTSTPLPQGAQGSGPTTPKGQAPPPATSSFSLTGSGTVAWGLTGATTKATSPTQQAGAAAISRAQSVKAGNTPVEKPNPPVVNIKNLDTMKGTMPPPVTFAPVASTVDPGTAKVVNQVIAEMAMASGVKPPQPGTVASASGDSLPLSPTSRKLDATTTTTTTQAASSAVVMTTASLSSKPVVSTIGGLSASSTPSTKSAPAVNAAAAFGNSEKPATTTKENPSAFSFSAKVPSSAASGSLSSSKGFSFGDKSLASSSSSGLSGAFSFGSKPASFTAAAEAPSAKGDGASQPSGSTESGVKPQIFDFSGAATKPKANVSTPGGYFFGAPTASSANATPGSSGTSNVISFKTPATSAQASTPAQPAPVKTSPITTSETKEKDVKSKDESGTGKPIAATSKPSQPVDEAGTGAAKLSSGTGSSSLLGAMLDKPPSGGSLLGAMLDKPPERPSQSSAAGEDENAKLQQSTKSILSGVTFPGGSSKETAQGGPAARNLFGTTPTLGATSGSSATSSATVSFGSSGLFSSIANTAKGSEASAPLVAPASQAATSSSSSLFGKTLFGAPTTSSGAGATASTSSAGFGLFGQPASTTTAKPSVFGQATATAASTSSAPVFGQPSGLFGQAAASTASSSGGPFGSGGFSFGGKSTLGPGGEGGTKSVFGSAFGTSQAGVSSSNPVFGGSNTSTLSFGQLANSGNTPASSTSGGGGAFGGGGGNSSGGGGFFSGLGGKPDPEAAKKNPFGPQPTASSGFGSPASSSSSIFGSSTAKAFGSPSSTAPAFGSSSSGAFGGSSGVANTGFGGFGQPPAFGQTSAASPGFGSPGAGGGGGLGFGTGATFSNPLGQSPFGSPQQANTGSVFGASSPAASTGGGFGNFASQNAPSFGALAGGGGGGGFGQQQPQQQSTGFGAFGGGGNNTGFGAFGSGSNNAFGGGGNNSSPGFTGGSSFTQYRH